MSDKHYNLTTTEDNGKSLTTTNISTKHPDEIVRLMTLAGLAAAKADQADCGCGEEVVAVVDEANPDAEYIASGPQELDLDDFSKKTADSISRQKKKIQPSHGDNPLEYSLDEDDIYESLLAEFDSFLAEEKVEEKDPCWKGYEQVGMKKKNGKEVPNCVPTSEGNIKEGRMSDQIIKDSETMTKEEFTKKYGKQMADEYFE